MKSWCLFVPYTLVLGLSKSRAEAGLSDGRSPMLGTWQLSRWITNPNQGECPDSPSPTVLFHTSARPASMPHIRCLGTHTSSILGSHSARCSNCPESQCANPTVAVPRLAGELHLSLHREERASAWGVLLSSPKCWGLQEGIFKQPGLEKEY